MVVFLIQFKKNDVQFELVISDIEKIIDDLFTRYCEVFWLINKEEILI